MKKTLFLTALLFSFCGCEDIFLKDISDETIEILSPAEDAELSHPTVLFRWSELEGAEEYQLIISSDPANPTQIQFDTLISKTLFSYTFDEGTYEWSIRARNFGYQTRYQRGVFTISSGEDDDEDADDDENEVDDDENNNPE